MNLKGREKQKWKHLKGSVYFHCQYNAKSINIHNLSLLIWSHKIVLFPKKLPSQIHFFLYLNKFTFYYQTLQLFFQLNHDYPANENVDTYCISMRWFRQWEMFVKGQEQGITTATIILYFHARDFNLRICPEKVCKMSEYSLN